MNAQYKVLVLFVVWLAWVLPFAIYRPKHQAGIAKTDRRAIWGVALQGIGFFCVFIHGPATWREPVAWWRVALCLTLAGFAWAYAWTSIRELGPQWRIQAGLNQEHKLVTTGAYKVVRHPIYASMLWLLLAGIALVGTLPLWPVGLALSILGLEIRMHIEDGLLRERFGEEFETWKRRTPAYFPPIR